MQRKTSRPLEESREIINRFIHKWIIDVTEVLLDCGEKIISCINGAETIYVEKKKRKNVGRE